jgi:hypothetical protein
VRNDVLSETVGQNGEQFFFLARMSKRWTAWLVAALVWPTCYATLATSVLSGQHGRKKFFLAMIDTLSPDWPTPFRQTAEWEIFSDRMAKRHTQFAIMAICTAMLLYSVPFLDSLANKKISSTVCPVLFLFWPTTLPMSPSWREYSAVWLKGLELPAGWPTVLIHMAVWNKESGVFARG